ncbi:molybdopterin molybdotransferase MoeA [Thiohalomonas denitrificans]|uniref:Molybdopterin molybdenumtransferase n=1 Tax=Thiohalomonas denitrificans TaxID=415747 RepID=A0A1G5PL26_9GAMM|nr:molybdopterin molybdotransferase MoeA [Thiohalomonas denitrificans]SCZ49881.1 molybdopterin molybdochelatase [Thiohalomonas denitrificans]
MSSQGSGLLPLDEALEKIRAALKPVAGYAQVTLAEALGRFLHEDILSPIDVPGHRNSAMDGYAVAGSALPESGEKRFRVAGTALAGAPYAGSVGPNEAVRIMTGAVVPEGTDTVIMQEKARREGEDVYFEAGHRSGENVRHPGEDIARNTVVLSTGRRITPSDVGLLASLGIAEVRVNRRLRVAIFSTGDELVPLGQSLGEGEIYDSNRYTVAAMLRRMDVDVLDMGVVRDDPNAIEQAFTSAAEVADVVITSGGVSVGEADFVKSTLDKLGEVDFWRIAMKPGKPLAFGRLGNAAFFGLPGNPVSAVATFYQVVQPSLLHLTGSSDTGRLRVKAHTTEKLKKRPGREDFQRGILESDASGNLVVRGTGMQGSHVLSSVSRANCFIVLPAESGDVEAGDEVTVEPFAAFM